MIVSNFSPSRVRCLVAVLQARFLLTCDCAAELFCSCFAGVAGPPKLWPKPVSPNKGVASGVGVVWRAAFVPNTEEKTSPSDSMVAPSGMLRPVFPILLKCKIWVSFCRRPSLLPMVCTCRLESKRVSAACLIVRESQSRQHRATRWSQFSSTYIQGQVRIVSRDPVIQFEMSTLGVDIARSGSVPS